MELKHEKIALRQRRNYDSDAHGGKRAKNCELAPENHKYWPRTRTNRKGRSRSRKFVMTAKIGTIAKTVPRTPMMKKRLAASAAQAAVAMLIALIARLRQKRR